MRLAFLSGRPLGHALGVLVTGTLLATAGLHCGSSGDDANPTPDDGGAEAGDSATTDTATDAGSDAPDAMPVVTCSKPPTFAPAMRVNHNPDSLRRVANGGMVQLPDGRLMLAILEAIDSAATHYGVFARIVDPTADKPGDDERLDTDADGLADSSGLSIQAVSGGAVVVRYGDSHLRVYAKGKWSPDLAATMPIAGGDTVDLLAAPSGQVLLTRAHDAAPFGQATVYRPDEGGVLGSWSAVQSLDLASASGRPTLKSRLMADGRFMTLVWQGGGPAIRIRSLSGAWQAPYPRAEIGAVDASPAFRLMPDDSVVLVALEGSGDTRRVVTSTWTATDGWTTARLLSKLTTDGTGVVPASPGPFLFGTGGADLEFVSWVAACSGAAKDCEFHPVRRRYSAGAWKDPEDLNIGTPTSGPGGLSVVALDADTPLVARIAGGTSIQVRVRVGAGDFSAVQTITKDSPLFGTPQLDARYYGGSIGLWSLVARTNVPGDPSPPTPVVTVAGKIDATGGSTSWGTVNAGSFELRGFDASVAYADGAGGFTVATNSATDGAGAAPIIAHFGASGGTPEAFAVISSDEASASFVNWPRTLARPGRDRASLFVVSARPSDMSVSGSRLRAYAWNGVGVNVPKLLASESRAPRAFGDGLTVFGCGGAILYAVDPSDGSHAAELVIVREASASTGDAGM